MACMRQRCTCNNPWTAAEGVNWPSSPLFWGVPQMCTTSGMQVPELEPCSPSEMGPEVTGTGRW